MFCESMREAILPSMMSWASSFSKASTGVLNAEAINVMSTETKGEKYCTIGGGGGEVEVEWAVVAVATMAARHLHHRLRSDVGVQLLDVVVEVEVDEEVGLEPLEVVETRRVPRLVEVGEQLAHLSRVRD